MKKLVVVNRKRFMLSCTLLITIIFTILISLFITVNNRAEGAQSIKYIEVYVEEGDTIWKLAKKFSSSNKDIRKCIYEIGQLNSLNNYDIFPGDIIKIPLE